jgi:hypothetical protein
MVALMTDAITTREGHTVKVEDLTWLTLEFLLFNMRDSDRRDMFGQTPTENVLAIAHSIINAEKGLAWCILINGRPSGALGVYEVHKGNWSIWSLGIDRPEVALLILERIFEHAIPHVKKHGGWRIQCKTRYDNAGNRTHLRLLGFRPEAMLRRFGTDRADYIQFVYFFEDAAADDKPLPQPSEGEPACPSKANAILNKAPARTRRRASPRA